MRKIMEKLELSNGSKVKASYKQRQLEAGKNPKLQHFHVTVVKSGAHNEGKSVLVETNHQSYLFNCGEGTQRILNEWRASLGTVEDVFLTHTSWENIGGLFGLMLSIGDFNMVKKSVKLHGPPNVEHVLKMTKHFSDSFTSVLDLEKREITAGTYSDWLSNIEYIKIPRANGMECDNGTIDESTCTSETTFDDSEEPASKRRKPEDKDCNFAVAYVIRIKDEICVPKVSREKLKALKVKSGPWISEVLESNSVTLEDGRVITKEDIIEKLPESVPPVVILECPNQDYLESLISSEQFLEMASNEKKQPCLMVHMTPTHMLDTNDYQMFMKRYEKTDHLLLNSKSKHSIVCNSITFHHCLNHLHSGLFPELHSYKTHCQLTVPSEKHLVQGESGLKYHVYGKKHGFDWSSCTTVIQDKTIYQMIDQELDTDVEGKEKNCFSNTLESSEKRPYPEIVFLGTASCKPGAYRNVSGILVNMCPEKSMLLDCGEGTCDQIRVFYGDKADELFSKIQAVFISHLHCDHHMGLFGIMIARQRALQKFGLPLTKLLVSAPIQYQRWLIMYSRYVENILDQTQLVQNLFKATPTSEIENMKSKILSTLDMEEFNPVPVKHVAHSFGLSIKHKAGWKIVYSGDTKPCKKLIDIGKGCDLLIHEATFSDDLEEDALMKDHSTTAQAIQVGQDMEAKFTLLTHFSQRYNKIPVFTDKFTDKVGFSFDLMKVTLDDLHIIPKLKNVMNILNSYSSKSLRAIKNSKEKDAATPESCDKKTKEKVHKDSTHQDLIQKINLNKGETDILEEDSVT